MDRTTILSAQTIRSEVVDVPEWGGKVLIRGLNATEHVEFYTRLETRPADDVHVGVLLLIECLRDETGNRLLTEADAIELQKQSGGMVNRLCSVCNRVNGIKDSAEKK